MYDFSTAEPAKDISFGPIPSGTKVRVITHLQAGEPSTPEGLMFVTKDGCWMLSFEFTVLDGPFARRKIWQKAMIGTAPGVVLTEGQEKAVAISGSFIRSILEQARNISPTDDSPAAMKARKINSFMDLNSLELDVIVKVERKAGYDPKNQIGRILPPTSGAGSFAAGNVTAPVAAPKRAAWA